MLSKEEVFSAFFLAAMLAVRLSRPYMNDPEFYVVYVLACGATIARTVETRSREAAWVRHRMKMRVR